jgi:hypothetical protein
MFFNSHNGGRVIPVGSMGAEWVAQFCAILAGVIFLLSGIVYLDLGHWTVTHLDFWNIYHVCLNHTWLESALLKHNGHSLFFPSFLWLADLRFFHGNQQVIFFAGLALFFITASQLFILVWRDKNVTPATKAMSALVLIIGNFWMARANITASGGFTWVSSLLLGGVELAFIYLPSMRTNSGRFWPATLAVVFGGVLASFSFGAGFATWPALLFLAWCLRLPRRSFAILLTAAFASAVVFILLPPHSSPPRGLHTPFAVLPAVSAGLVGLCRVLGAPIFYAASGWYAKPLRAEAALSSFFVLWCGAFSLTVAAITMGFSIIRRNLPKSGLALTGMALVAFNLIAMILIVIGRAEHFRTLPFHVMAPRYLFFSTLFWAGLLLLAIQHSESKPWLRWATHIGVLALPVLVFPSHYKDGLTWRWARHRAESGATSLINGVQDEQQVKSLFPVFKQIFYGVAGELRARRLDMFADGLQDWIGVNEAAIFGGRHKRVELQGQCRVDALLLCDNGAPAARIVGHVSKHGRLVPKTFVIADPTGVICGIARSSTIYSESPLINRAFYLSKFRPNVTFLGYIRGYDANLQYLVRSADSRTLSDETIAVSVPGSASVHPP